MSHFPTNSTETPTASGLAGYNKLTREKVLDRKIDTLFQIPSVTVASLAGVAAGAPITQELGTSGLVSIFMADADDAYSVLWVVPPEADLTKQIDFRVLWTQSQGAGTGSCLWTIKYRPVVAGGATALTAPCTAVLDEPIASQADLGADIPQWTGWGSISENKSGVCTMTAGDDMMQVDIISDTHTTITDVDLLSAQVRYYVKLI